MIFQNSIYSPAKQGLLRKGSVSRLMLQVVEAAGEYARKKVEEAQNERGKSQGDKTYVARVACPRPGDLASTTSTPK